MLHNFPITPGKPVSNAFIERGITDFSSALIHIQDLPYGRNSDRSNPLLVLKEQSGTCSTKHALIKLLADENEKPEIKLMMGIYKMNETNTKKVTPVLKKYNLEYIPEAHTYLRMGNKVVDITKRSFANTLFLQDILEEEEITPAQIGSYKLARHKEFLSQWLDANKQVPYHLQELWSIREECIEALSAK
jgi:hypothetical protein